MLWATDTLVQFYGLQLVANSQVLDSKNNHIDERLRTDTFRSIATKRIIESQKEKDAIQQKMYQFYQVERKKEFLGKLRMANNERRAIALKLQNNLLFTSLCVVLVSCIIVIVGLYLWRKEHEKRTMLIRRTTFAAREQEKLRFSRELHDDFQSTLSIIHMMAVHERERSPENQRMEELRQSSKNAIQEVRKMSEVLYPSSINTDGWIECLKSLIHRTNYTDSTVNFHFSAEPIECDKEVQLVLYRITEILMEIRSRYGRLETMDITIRKKHKFLEFNFYMDNIPVFLEFEANILNLIREQAYVIGGKLKVRRKGKGVCVDIVFVRRIPMP